MSTMHAETDSVKPDADFTLNPDRVEGHPSTWPAWCDADCWAPTDPGPDATDQAWAAEAFGGDDYEAILDEYAAASAAALDSLERSMIPGDLAREINRTSLAGSADEVLHEGSAPGRCNCEPCVLDRTARFAE